MASQEQSRAEQLALASGTITLAHFTPESTTDFLKAVAKTVTEKVAPGAGPSPWLPSYDPDHRGALTAPSGDGRPFTFGALTHLSVTRALVGADPANLRDTASLIAFAAEGTSDYLRLLALRIAIRWNNAMSLLHSDILVDVAGAPEITAVESNQPIPATTVIEENDQVFVVNEATGTRLPGAASAATSAAHREVDDEKAPERQDASPAENEPTVTDLSTSDEPF